MINKLQKTYNNNNNQNVRLKKAGSKTQDHARLPTIKWTPLSKTENVRSANKM